MLVDQVKGIPLVVILDGVRLRLAIGVEALIQQLVHVEVEVLREAFGLHIIATVPVEVEVKLVAGDFL